MLRKILPPLLVLLMLLLDCTILPLLGSFSLMPLWTLLTIHCFGLLFGRSSGALYGLIAGVLIDILVSTPLGLMTALYTGMGYLGGCFAQKRLKQPFIPLLSALAGFSGYELILMVYVMLASGQISALLAAGAAERVIIHTILALAICWIYEKLLRPARSRYVRV